MYEQYSVSAVSFCIKSSIFWSFFHSKPISISNIIICDPVDLSTDHFLRNILHFFGRHTCINTARFTNRSFKNYSPAAIIVLLFTTAPSITIAPIPINTLSCTVHPCTIALCPIETLLPIVVPNFL